MSLEVQGRQIDGWQLIAVIPGEEADTRKFVEVWASSIEDENSSIEAVKRASGASAVVVLIPLEKSTLHAMGITEANKCARISAVF